MKLTRRDFLKALSIALGLGAVGGAVVASATELPPTATEVSKRVERMKRALAESREKPETLLISETQFHKFVKEAFQSAERRHYARLVG